MKTEGREVNLDQVTPHVVHPGLHQDYNLDFQMRRVDDIAPTLTSPMLAGLVSSIRLTGRPVVPKGPASPKTEEGLWGHGGAPAWPDVPGPSHISRPMETEGNKPLEQAGIDLDATIPAFTSEDAAAVIISDDEATSFPGGWPEAVSTPKIELAWGHKDPRRTGVHTHLLRRSGLQKKRRRVCLLVKQLSREGCQRKTSSPRDMKSLPRITTGSRA